MDSQQASAQRAFEVEIASMALAVLVRLTANAGWILPDSRRRCWAALRCAALCCSALRCAALCCAVLCCACAVLCLCCAVLTQHTVTAGL